MNSAVTPDDLWIRRYRPAATAEVRLACFPHAGGAASFYLPLSKALAPECEVLSVQYPGRQDRRDEPCAERIGDLAEIISEQLLRWTDKPLALFGHSMGAIVAYEVARILEARGVELVALFASGRRSPTSPRVEGVHRLPDRVLLARVLELGGMDRKLLGDKEIMQMIVPALRGDYRAIETYRWQPGAVVSAPLDVHVGDADPAVTLDEARDWENHTSGEFEMHRYAGGHFYVNDYVDRLTAAIRDRLRGRACPDVTTP